jgi:uncharacterized damage-inducible protein DinB
MTQRANRKLSSSVIWLLDSGDAHQRAHDVLRGFPRGRYGERPPGFAHSAWQLVEHLRIAQEDIMRYCLDPKYRSPRFPEGYWPRQPEPPNRAAWALSARAFLRDLRAAQRLARAHEDDLLAPLPHAAKVTWLDELLLIADHNSYHVGQLMQLRRALEATAPRGKRRRAGGRKSVG